MRTRPLCDLSTVCIISEVPLDRFELSSKDPESLTLSVKLRGLKVLLLFPERLFLLYKLTSYLLHDN